MSKYTLKVCLLFFAFFAITTFGDKLSAQPDRQHTMVAMRTIGHRVLLTTGDSTSMVMPVVQNGNRYTIPFEHDFVFNPLQLAYAIDSVMRETELSQNYIVEMTQCASGEIVYSYEISGFLNNDLIPCAARIPSLDCYMLNITLRDADTKAAVVTAPSETNHASTIALAMALLLGLGAFWAYRSKKKRTAPMDPNAVSIGKYIIDKRNMELLYGDQKVELTGKETELLVLLHSSVNNTLEREVILRTVWGDEGDYIGRTLDVFISKLRKKLEDDPTVKIANIRGIGYKLVVNDRV